jgi:hypothetical protein
MNTCTAVSDEALAVWFHPALVEVLGDALKVMRWDFKKLSAQLKARSELVDDFFGRNWVAAFLGREPAERSRENLVQSFYFPSRQA